MIRLLIAGTAMVICALGGALIARLSNYHRRVNRTAYHALLGELLLEQSQSEWKLAPPSIEKRRAS